MSQPTTITAPSRSRQQVVLRVLAAMLGGYVFAWGTVALATSLLFAAKLDFHDAEFLGTFIGLVTYVVVFLWSIATKRLLRIWIVLLGGGLLMAGIASLVQSLLV
ncbi:MAG TPA: iron uptake protein [Stenotrophomonas sp.]